MSIGDDIKRAQRRASHKKRGSRNRKRANIKVQKLFQKRSNRMKNARNKILSATKPYQMAVQDDNVAGWQAHKNWGRKVAQFCWGHQGEMEVPPRHTRCWKSHKNNTSVSYL